MLFLLQTFYLDFMSTRNMIIQFIYHLLSLCFQTWIICWTEFWNNVKINKMQGRLVGIIPRFCEANWLGVTSAQPCTTPLPTKAFKYICEIPPNLTYYTWLICPTETRNNSNQLSLRQFTFKIVCEQHFQIC